MNNDDPLFCIKDFANKGPKTVQNIKICAKL